jgi:hypothetical protein
MRMRLIGRLLALVGLYALVLAAIGTRHASQAQGGSYQTGLIELVVATALLLVVAVVVVTRRPREPREPFE